MWMKPPAICCPCWLIPGHLAVKRQSSLSKPDALISAVRRRGLIAAIAPNCRLYLAGQDQPFSSEDIVWFLDKLCQRYRKRDLLLIWAVRRRGGAAIHRSQAVKAQLSRKPGRIHLERLPAYSPELNPVELLWSHLKRSLKNHVFTSLEQLQVAVLDQVERLQADPKLVTSFFRKKEVAFFTD